MPIRVRCLAITLLDDPLEKLLHSFYIPYQLLVFLSRMQRIEMAL